MVSAVVLVNTDVSEETRVLESVKSLQEVEEAKALGGVYDLMVKVKSSSSLFMGNMIMTVVPFP